MVAHLKSRLLTITYIFYRYNEWQNRVVNWQAEKKRNCIWGQKLKCRGLKLFSCDSSNVKSVQIDKSPCKV